MAKITPGVTFANDPGWQKSLHDDLRLPSGARVGDVDSGPLYSEFDRLKIPGFRHTLGRLDAIEAYAKHLAAIAKAGADQAVADYLRGNLNNV
jgi:hypothetical protein